MASENFTPVDYEALKQALRIKMKSDPRFKDYDFEGSGLSAIIKMMASMASSQNLNSHFVLGESHFSTSDILGNVQALVTAANGYVPSSQTSSRATVTIEVTPPTGVTPPASLTLPLTFSTLGIQDGKSYRFTPLEEKTVPLASGKYVFDDVIMLEGERVTNTFVQGGTALSYFTIPNKSVDINTLSVTVRESVSVVTTRQFERFHSAFQLGPESDLFFLSMDRNGLYRVNFGDGRFSKALIDGNIVYVSYKSSNGEFTNGVSKLTATSEIGGFSDVAVTVTSSSRGGTAQEGIESIQRNASLSYGMDGVAVATQEYGLKLKELYPSSKITQWDGSENDPPKPGFVILSAYPPLTAAEKAAGVEWLKKYSVGSILTTIIDPKSFEVDVDLFYVSSYTDEIKVASQRAEVKAFCSNYSNNMSGFGLSFEPNIFETELREAVSGIERCYATYVLGTAGVRTKKSISFDFHHEIASGSFNVAVSGSSNVDTIRHNGSEMVGFKTGVKTITFSFEITPLGIVTIGDLDLLTEDTVGVAPAFGTGRATPNGEDKQISSSKDEILQLTFKI